jgi:hypothetical protein
MNAANVSFYFIENLNPPYTTTPVAGPQFMLASKLLPKGSPGATMLFFT